MNGTLFVVGIGLIGGSVARGLRESGFCQHVTGVDTDAGNLARALSLGVIDHACTLDAIRPGAGDIVLLAAPVGSFQGILRALQPHWHAETLYTDAGSTKLSVLRALHDIFGEVPCNFVPGHPIAGAEQSGVEASSAVLFDGRRVILTPASCTLPAMEDRARRLWESLGATVSCMSADEHDEVLAATSHLPHMLAFALTAMLGRRDETENIFRYAAGGFRDFSRIASSDPVMWADIALANQSALLDCLRQYRDTLVELESAIAHADQAALHSFFSEARAARGRFLQISEK
ncbi:MAG: prephenate dehydrogenase [Pseudomonadota bacterium]|jgi:prephenate dehydrogenase